MINSSNEFEKEVKDLCLAMGMVTDFHWGDLHSAVQEDKKNFPLCCSFYTVGSMTRNTTQLTWKIDIADKIFADESNLDEVASDTLLTCRKLYNIINKSPRWQRIGKANSVSFTKFKAKTPDILAGHSITIQFSMRTSSSFCDAPIFGYDTGAQIPVKPYGTITNSNGTFIDEVEINGTFILPDTVFDVYLDGLFSGTVNVPTLDPSGEINITLT